MIEDDFAAVLRSGDYVAASDLARAAVDRPDRLPALKALMENAYLNGNADVRALIANGLLKHLAEDATACSRFASWRGDARLCEAWKSADGWARRIGRKTRILKGVGELCAREFAARGLQAVVDDPEIGVDSITLSGRVAEMSGYWCSIVTSTS
ncbi:MAG TPA: hypothetical protein VF846_00995 [Thermoanaerobaculia bacterium]|jgi:hypothetical protein